MYLVLITQYLTAFSCYWALVGYIKRSEISAKYNAIALEIQ